MMDFMHARDEGLGEEGGFMLQGEGKPVYNPQASSSWPSSAAANGSEREDEAEKLDLMESSSPREDDPKRDAPPSPIEREHMFDKVVTPSDVGKLNRLVIPKQHAEKYFPLDSSTNEKGLLLNFEDRNGKPWRFRYSYWNSSQSYVMTKGWSRFVKEKKLDAGDIVSFQRGVGEAGKDRLFIDWRRRPDAPEPTSVAGGFPILPGHFAFHQAPAVPWSPLILRPGGSRDHQQLNNMNYSSYWNRYGGGGGSSSGCGGSSDSCGYGYGSIVNLNNCTGLNSVYYITPHQLGAIGSGGGGVVGGCSGSNERVVLNSVPIVQGKAAAKRLRLFGVNMECPLAESDERDVVLSSTSISHAQNQHHHYNHHHQQQQQQQQQHHYHRSASSSPSSSGFQPPLQLRLYDGMPVLPPPSTMSMPTADFLNKGKASSMSLDLDI